MSTKLQLERGTYRLIRCDGSDSTMPLPYAGAPVTRMLGKEIGAETLDCVILTRGRSQAGIVMLVDDTGMIDGKPVNAKATEIYRSICKPGTVHSIHGDVALVHDGDC